MKTYKQAYFEMMRDCARRLPLLLTPEYYDWRGLRRELRDAFNSLVALLILVGMVLLYPISIFVVPAVTLELERRAIKRRKREHAEYIKRMHGWGDE